MDSFRIRSVYERGFLMPGSGIPTVQNRKGEE